MAEISADPSKYLPVVMARFLRFPRKLAFIWCAIVIVVLLVVSQTGSSYISPIENGGSASNKTEGGIQVSISGPLTLALSVNSPDATITQGSTKGDTIHREESGELKLTEPSGNLVASLRGVEKDGERVVGLYDANGSPVYVLKPDDEGYKVLSSSRVMVARVKFKEEKFNIYDSTETRLYYGKEKKGSIVVRDDSGADISWIAASNSPPLKQVAPLCLPLPEPYRALLYLDALYSSGS